MNCGSKCKVSNSQMLSKIRTKMYSHHETDKAYFKYGKMSTSCSVVSN